MYVMLYVYVCVLGQMEMRDTQLEKALRCFFSLSRYIGTTLW